MDKKLAAKMAAQERKWQAQADLSTLQQAETVKADSARMKAAQAQARQQAAALAKITGKKRK